MYDYNCDRHCKGRVCGTVRVCKRLLDPETESFRGEGIRGLNPKAIVGVPVLKRSKRHDSGRENGMTNGPIVVAQNVCVQASERCPMWLEFPQDWH